MCDYSLHLTASRPAKVGETLITTKFHAFTRGFSSVQERNVAVCLLPGTELSFEREVQYDTVDFGTRNVRSRTRWPGFGK